MRVLELTCPECDVTLQAGDEAELVELGLQHERSIHDRAASREHVLTSIWLQNR
ncbi:hypothetical protein JCM18899A_51470 [Nocardioides sp. AN3]